MRAPALLALGLAVGLTACTDAGPGPGTGEGGNGGADETEDLRLGRVHVVLSTPQLDQTGDGLDGAGDAGDAGDTADGLDDTADGFELTARFAMVRGLDEEFVRARADMPDLLEDLLNPGQCASESALWPSDLVDPPDSAELGRELVLVDAGELEVQLGSARLEVPLTLVPDLLPYMSGVEYAYFADSPVLPEMDDPDMVTVVAAGGLTDELPAFTVESPMPGALGLTYTAEDLGSLQGPDGGALVVRWDAQAEDDDAAVGLRLTPMLAGEPLGDDIICLVADRGQTRLDLTELRTLGFAPDADAVRVEASRSRTSLFDAGAWAGTELVVERRDAALLPLR